jgi:hypothetical protein
MYHSPGPFQPADTHAVFYVSGKQLILEPHNGLLEGPALMLKPAVTVDLCYQRSIADLTECHSFP